jgi:hypothetical protein
VRTHGSSTAANVSSDSQSLLILYQSLSLCSEKKTTKVKTMDGVTTTHSGRVTPAATASGDESTDNCELGAEAPGEEMDTTTSTTPATEDAVMGGPDADNLATLFANLDSPADRYVLPFSPLFAICVMTGQLAYCSLSHLSCLLSRHIARHLSLSLPPFPSRASQSPFGWGCFLLSFPLSMSSLPYTCFRVFWGCLDRT